VQDFYRVLYIVRQLNSYTARLTGHSILHCSDVKGHYGKTFRQNKPTYYVHPWIVRLKQDVGITAD